MQPESPLLRTYRQLTTRVMLEVGGAFDSSNASGSSPVGQARRTWRPAPNQLQAIDDALAAFGEAVVAASTDPNLSSSGRAAALDRATATVRAAVDTASADVLQRIDSILTGLRAAAYPSRPTGDVTAQEATLAGIKADARMLLDAQPADGDLIADVLLRLLRRALGDGDQLATWLLASSHWPLDYLESRGVAGYAVVWNAKVAQVLDQATPRELAETRRVYRIVSDGKTGLPVLRVLFASTLPQILEQLGQWQLHPQPSPVPGW